MQVGRLGLAQGAEQVAQGPLGCLVLPGGEVRGQAGGGSGTPPVGSGRGGFRDGGRPLGCRSGSSCACGRRPRRLGLRGSRGDRGGGGGGGGRGGGRGGGSGGGGGGGGRV